MTTELHGIPLAGVRLDAPLGSGADGQTWSATTPQGARVAIRALPQLPAERARARDERLAVWSALEHPGLVRVMPRPPGGDPRLLVTALVAGPTLATVRTGRLGLGAAEALSLAHDLMDALSVLHAAGVVHGDVSPANVVLTQRPGPVGEVARPVLVDPAADPTREGGTPGFVAPEVAERGRPSTAGDVWSAATTCVWAAHVIDRDRVARMLGDAVADDPEVRPAAADLSVRLAERTLTPVRVPAASVLAGAALREQAQRAPTVVRPRRRRRARHRRTSVASRVALLAVVLLLLVGGWAGWSAWQRGSTEGAAAAQEQPLLDRVTELVRQRDAALVAGDAQALAALTVPGSPAQQQDAELLAELAADDVVLADLRTETAETTVIERTTSEAVVRTELRQGAHERWVDGAVSTVPPQPPRCVDLGLALHEGRWRVATVSDC